MAQRFKRTRRKAWRQRAAQTSHTNDSCSPACSCLLLSDCTVGPGTSPDHATSSGVRALPPIGNWESTLRLPSPCPEDIVSFVKVDE